MTTHAKRLIVAYGAAFAVIVVASYFAVAVVPDRSVRLPAMFVLGLVLGFLAVRWAAE